MNYYNDNDPKSVAWLRELIKQNVIPFGHVDERSIKDVTKSDLEGYIQCHFFAGIGGWSEALRLAEWSTDTPIWTGSCPCQPFSCAGKQKGKKDERHLWPEFYRLIRECKPNVIFGEQVERAIGMGWFDGIFADLEVEDYTCGAAVLGAHSVGAPQVRQRLYWVADSESSKFQRNRPEQKGQQIRPTNSSNFSGMGYSNSTGCEKQYRGESIKKEQSAVKLRSDIGFWSKSIWIPCADGKARRIEPSICPLADGIPGRVGLLRGYGNAIVPQVAAEFIKAYMEIKQYPIMSSAV